MTGNGRPKGPATSPTEALLASPSAGKWGTGESGTGKSGTGRAGESGTGNRGTGKLGSAYRTVRRRDWRGTARRGKRRGRARARARERERAVCSVARGARGKGEEGARKETQEEDKTVEKRSERRHAGPRLPVRHEYNCGLRARIRGAVHAPASAYMLDFGRHGDATRARGRRVLRCAVRVADTGCAGRGRRRRSEQDASSHGYFARVCRESFVSLKSGRTGGGGEHA